MTSPSTTVRPATDGQRDRELRPLLTFAAVALPIGWVVLGIPVAMGLPQEPFVLAGLLALAIAVGTVAGHALRVARLNPIHALRYE
jgi:putative ABC transport system permease protein